MRSLIILAAASGLLAQTTAGDPPRYPIDLRGDHFGAYGLPFPESVKPIRGIGLTAAIDQKGEGSGVLVLIPGETNAYDEFGFPSKAAPAPSVKLDCKLKFVKKAMVKGWPYRLMEGPGEPMTPKQRAMEYEWRLYSITGPKITSRLFLSVPIGEWSWTEARFLIHDNEGKVKHVVHLDMPRYKP
jgi:hypothetical protein